MSIIVKDVVKKYKSQLALNHVSFSIDSGEIVGFLGPNGAGKSTMMKIICGYISSTSGSVQLSGIDVLENTLEAQEKIGYLPEHNPLYLDMYVKEFLSFVGGVHKMENIKDRIEEVIGLVGLEKEQNKKIGQLSKGYRQRVGIAQALFHDPEVLILDEPTTGLDPNQIIEIRNLIKTIGKNKTVMLSTHIMQEVEAICSRAIIINEGSIVADDKIESLQLDFNKSKVYLFELSEAIQDQTQKIEGIDVLEFVASDKLKVSGVGNIPKIISEWALKNENTVIRIEEKSVSLEDVFHKLTQKIEQ